MRIAPTSKNKIIFVKWLVADKQKVLYNLGLLFRRQLKGEEIGVTDISQREAGGKRR